MEETPSDADPAVDLTPFRDAIREVIATSTTPIWSPGTLGVRLRAAAADQPSTRLAHTITAMRLTFTVNGGWRSPVSDAALTELLVLGDVTATEAGYQLTPAHDFA